jgi:hypothetical protein
MKIKNRPTNQEINRKEARPASITVCETNS